MPDADLSSSTKAVFLSYSSDDTAVALAVCEALREAGVEVWMDRSELQGGDAWDANIQRQIRECALIIPIISKRTQARREGYFRLEWRLADERMRLVADGTPLILPVAADETREQDALVPKSFLSVQWSRLPHGHVPPAFVARVKKLLGQESAVVSNSVPAVGTPPTPMGHTLVTLNAPAVAQPMRAANDGATLSRRSLWPVTGAAILALLVGFAAAWFLKASTKGEPQDAAKPLVRFTHELPSNIGLRGAARPVAAISPDGRSCVYNTTAGLFLRRMDEFEARVIPGTEEIPATYPVFSPDNQWLAFYSGFELRKIPISGGASVAIAATTDQLGFSWGSDGAIVYGQLDGIWRIGTAGAAPEHILRAREGEVLSRPQTLPGGKSILLSVRTTTGASQVEIGSIIGGERKIVVPGGMAACYLPNTGHLLYILEGDLFGVAFDPYSRMTLGAAHPLLQGLRSAATAVNFTVSDNGTLLYLANREPLTVPVWVDRQGKEEPIALGPARYGSFALSPDGSRLAIGVRTSPTTIGIVVWDFAGETGTRLTLGAGSGSVPLWSSDGSRVYFDSYDGRISAKPANNTRPPEIIVERPDSRAGRISPYSLTPDGRLILFASSSSSSASDIGVASVEAKGEIRWLLKTKSSEETPALSPDGKWMAYCSDESGRKEVYVSPFPKVDEDRILISNAGGDRPVWSHDGKELFYVGGVSPPTQKFMSAVVAVDGGKFRVLSRTPLWNGTNQSLHYVTDSGARVIRPIEPSRNGQRFLILKEVSTESSDQTSNRIYIVQNWTEELKRLVPIPKN